MSEKTRNSRGKRTTQKGARVGKSEYRGKTRQEDVDNSSSGYARNHRSNDPSWYAANPQLLKDAASLAYSNPLGTVVPSPIGDSYHGGSSHKAVPGIMTLQVIPTPGVSTDNTSAVNVAAKNIYSYIRYANSGHSNYDPADIMMYILAMDSAYTYWAHLVRAYGTLNSYAASNRYYARAMVEAMGFSFDDLMKNIADFRAYINTYAYKLGSICCPASMTFITRHVWMMSHVWVDSASRKAQTYMYTPRSLWKYDETGSPLGGGLIPVDIGPNFTLNDIQSVGNDLLHRILSSEDLGIMSGDILKAFGADKLLKVSTIPENFYVVPSYDEAVSSQFQNAFIFQAPQEADAWRISQDPDTGAVIFDPTWSQFVTDMYLPSRLFLNMRKDTPEPADTMVATRMMATYIKKGDKYHIESCGSEIAVCGTLYQYHITSQDGQNALSSVGFWSLEPWYREATMAGSQVMKALMLEKFDWHPMVYHYSVAKDKTAPLFLDVSGDLDNYTLVSNYELEKMHTVALLSEFGCPNMGPFAQYS